MSSKKRLYVLLLLAAVFVYAGSSSARELRIVSMEIGNGLQTSESPGLYGELLLHVLKQAQIDYDLRVYPFKRALRVFFDQEADCIWALDSKALRTFNRTNAALVDSRPLLTATQHVFMMPDAAPLSGLNDLSGKSVGLHYSSSMLGALEGISAQIVSVADQRTKVRLLINNRVDAIVGWLPDLLVTARSVDIDPARFKSVLKVSQSDVGLVCHYADIPGELLATVNSAISDFLGSPQYWALLAKHGASMPDGFGD